MFKASIDQARLERSLKRFAKDFGDTNAQAIARWGVQTCRELAAATQVWGRSKTRGIQEGAIFGDSLNVLLVVDRLTSTGKGYRADNQGKTYYASRDKVLLDAQSVNDWIELNRTRRRGRTAVLPVQERKVCAANIHRKAMRVRYKNAGIAKGGWIGAGKDIARAQKGTDRINIGKNFLGYAHKHSRFGRSTHPRDGWNPFAFLTNTAAHVSSRHVLSPREADKAMTWGIRKTTNWYRQALKKQDQKQKP